MPSIPYRNGMPPSSLPTITYVDALDGLTPDSLTGFFQGWPFHPSPEMHLRILQNSARVWLAMDDSRCVGFVNALTDGVFCAFLPLLEVLPEYRGRGIGSELVRRMAESFNSMYAVDLICDQHLTPFYQRLGFSTGTAMLRRNYANQAPKER